MDGEAIPTEVSDAKREGSREDTSSSEESIKNDCQTLFIPKKWTNEKHKLYLRTMETSFLNQLYYNENASSDLLGFLPLVTPEPTRKFGSTTNFFHFSCQSEFTGRRSYNFASKRAQYELKKEITQLFANPWIRRFTSRGTLDPVDSNELTNLAKPSSNTSPNHKQADSSHIPRQHYAEVSDQNFDNIEYEGQSDARVAKRKRDPTVNPPIKDEQFYLGCS